MIFALGFLTAGLCALMVLPAVNARAIRLSRRRLEGLFPLSGSEIAAEKDYLRAHFAVTQRRLERKVEAARASRHADMAAIGARTLEIAALAREVEARDATLASTRETLGGVERDLASARSDGTLGLATLNALESAHRDLLDDLNALRDAVALSESVPAAQDDGDLNARYLAVLAECDALRAARPGVDAEIATLRQRIVEVADALLQGDRLPSVEAFVMPSSKTGAVPVQASSGP